MKEIIVTSKKHGEQITFVDDADFEKLAKHKWHLEKPRPTSSFYAVRYNNDNHKFVKMHREILGIMDSKIKVDHKDRNGLNNQRSNLRIATYSQNASNCKGRAGSSSKYKGVSKLTTCRRWVAQIWKDKKKHYLGLFKTEKDAAIAYNKEAEKLHGEFAYINKI